ncbi:MAG: LPS export ABC transporter ATP-binding protein [Gammaproteobacteria bacterium]|nr:LPS export ABC transporter ATP-binding protein [Gammaproteobacteria bacterium]MCP5135451.1 LPS export ABC transporter ATP-binding protein [Gammaproteobacteria bacterium]
MSQLLAQDLVKRYKSFTAVGGVTLEVNSGEIVGLLGPNGAGKTTSFYMIVGLVPANGGKVLLDGKDLTPYPMHARARMGVGYLPQEPSVFRKLSVGDNIMAILEARPELNRHQRHALRDQVLAELNIGHLRDQVGMSLSGGERRRVEIARALAAEPRFILLDEPFAGVDPISVIDIQRIVEHLTSKGIGVLITDHNVRETLTLCHRAYIVSQGKVIASGTAEQILDNKQVRDVYLGEHFRL